jgi:phosphoglucosamine mutase
MVQEGRSLSDLARLMTRYPQVLLNFTVSRKVPLDSLPPVKAAIARVERALGQDGRVLVRYSGTEAKARVMIEGVDESSIRVYAEDIAECLRTSLAQA